MTAMAAYHDQVTVIFLGQAVDLLSRLPVSQVLLLRSQARVAVGKACDTLASLVELLLLEHGQIHRNIATERHGHRFDDMHQRQLGVARGRQSLGPRDERMALVVKVGSDQNMMVVHDYSPGCACSGEYGPCDA